MSLVMERVTVAVIVIMVLGEEVKESGKTECKVGGC